MDGEPVPEEEMAKLEAALSSGIGMHGPWVMAIETYDEGTGEPRLSTIWSTEGTGWTKLGMAYALVEDLSVPYRRDTD